MAGAFYPEKFQVIHMCTKKIPHASIVQTTGHTLESVESAQYLGVTLSEDLSRTPHVVNTATKASKTLGFLSQNMQSHTGPSFHTGTGNNVRVS